MPETTARTPHRKPAASRWRAGWRMAALLLALFAMLGSTTAAAAGNAADEAGSPFIQNFAPETYHGSPQNLAFTEGRDGIVYVGNADAGILAFDGTRWTHIAVPHHMPVLSLATAPDGRIYVGGIGDFGYLKADAHGELHFVSLKDKLPAANRNLAEVWNTFALGTDVYFSTVQALYRLHDGTISVIRPKTTIFMSFQVGDSIYTLDLGRGLFRVEGDHLVPAPEGNRFAHTNMFVLLPWRGPGARPGELLAHLRKHGWERYDGTHWEPWRTTADAALAKAAVYRAAWLANGELVVATLRDGVFILDAQGNLRQHINADSGLTSNLMMALHVDREQGVWLATDNGISRLDTGVSLTRFDTHSGLPGSVLAIERFAGALYAGTTRGLFRLTTGANQSPRFDAIAGITGQVGSLAVVDNQLLVAGDTGVHAITANGAVTPLAPPPHSDEALAARALLRSSRDPARVFISYEDGLGVWQWDGKQWNDVGRVPGMKAGPTSMVQATDGQLWLTRMSGGVTRLILPADWRGPQDPRGAKIVHFGEAAGLPNGEINVSMLGRAPGFISDKGIYRFDAADGQFHLDPAFHALYAHGPHTTNALYVDPHGGIWAYILEGGSGHAVYARNDGGHWQWMPTRLQPLADREIYAFHTDADGTTWIGGQGGLYRHAATRTAYHAQPFGAIIRAVVGRSGQVLRTSNSTRPLPAIPYAGNALRFEFAATSFDFPDATTFQVKLDGIDNTWSAWSRNTYREYTNLHEGTYTFHVRARNVFGVVGRAASVTFRILPPWFRTWWAWTLWIALGVLALALLLRWRSTALRHRNRELAALVELRTAELAKANAALTDSNRALAQQSVTDPLTGLKNRRYLYEHIAPEWSPHTGDGERRQAAAAVATLLFIVDIDHFKHVNDTWGHAAGDELLRQFCDVLRSVARDGDTLVRWGGEEFLLVAPHGSPDAGPRYAERIRSAVASRHFDIGAGEQITLTCSIGFATMSTGAGGAQLPGWEQVLHLADECLYSAKRHGRNAWAGVLATTLPAGTATTAALHQALDAPAAREPLAIATSWTQGAPPAEA